MAEIALGTAQFGLHYGITNSKGQCSKQAIENILKEAVANGLRYIDTAAQYGTSETVLGEFSELTCSLRVLTKTASIAAELSPSEARSSVLSGFETSLKNLHLSDIYGLLLHDPGELAAPRFDAIWDGLRSLKSAGRVTKIGVSVYTESDLEILTRRCQPDIVQVPVSIFDQRLLQSGWLGILKAQGVEIHARSIFLQGLTLQPINTLPAQFQFARNEFEQFHAFIGNAGLTPVSAGVRFINSCHDLDVAVVGVTCADELQEILDAAYENSTADLDWRSVASHSERLIDPRKWDREPARAAN